VPFRLLEVVTWTFDKKMVQREKAKNNNRVLNRFIK
jgi:hypothetical protein